MKPEDLQPGDILLSSHSENFIGDLIAWYTQGKWTHAMMYVGRYHGRYLIIESHYGGVKYTTLEAYRDKGYDVCVLRSDASAKELRSVIDGFESEIGRGYDYKGLFGYVLSDIVYNLCGVRKFYDDADDRFCVEPIKHYYEFRADLDLTNKPSSNSSPMDLRRSALLTYKGEIEW